MTLNVKDLPVETGLLHNMRCERMAILNFPLFATVCLE